MLTQKTGWKIIEEITEFKDEKNSCKELMVVYDREEAKKILEFFADLEKYRKDPFKWNRSTHLNTKVMWIIFQENGGHGRVCLSAKLINFVEEES